MAVSDLKGMRQTEMKEPMRLMSREGDEASIQVGMNMDVEESIRSLGNEMRTKSDAEEGVGCNCNGVQ